MITKHLAENLAPVTGNHLAPGALVLLYTYPSEEALGKRVGIITSVVTVQAGRQSFKAYQVLWSSTTSESVKC